ncbi:MAG: toll/interleukin-1 receptor domain-containing protein, partial [Altibacter sp.]|nr:toll/interleukin-1 receptor domain-containing protein [Altibacter sp.]
MNKHHVFFSYSRENSDFVLELAKKLRNAGAQVWLDQLDIKTGERWDKSIEQALSASDVLMVVLSKASVESNNVMDEVSYALEEGKKVLPILLEECDVPFRLRRL